MKVWQKIVSKHHNIEVLSDKAITVFNVIYDTNTKLISDDIVTRHNDKYYDSQGNIYDSIHEYLGY